MVNNTIVLKILYYLNKTNYLLRSTIWPDTTLKPRASLKIKYCYMVAVTKGIKYEKAQNNNVF